MQPFLLVIRKFSLRPTLMRLIVTILLFLSALSSKADIIGMLKPTIIYTKVEKGDTLEMRVEYEQWNYFHTHMGHKWTESYHFDPSGILILSYGDGDFASDTKRYWKNKYEPLGNNKLKRYYYVYPDETTTFPETNKYLSHTNTVTITDAKYDAVTLKNRIAYINEHSAAFASRSKAFSGKNKATEKVFEAIVNKVKDKLTEKEQPKSKKSYAWLYISGSILLISAISFFLVKKYRNKQAVKA